MEKSYIVRLFVPSTKSLDQKISSSAFNDRANKVSKIFNDLFGGSTIYNGNGSYNSNEGKLIKEKVKIVESIAYGNSPATMNSINKARVYAETFASTWGQECILFTAQSIVVEFVGT
jgi:hypothetical protein